MLTALCAAVLMWAAFAAPALAESPVTLASGYMTDKAGVVGSEKASVEQALEQLYDDQGVQLFVVYVASFGGMDSQDWTDETFDKNGLGLNDILLAVAVEDRQYAWSVQTDFPLNNNDLEGVAQQYIEPELHDSNWAAAATAAAEGYGAAIEAAAGSGTDGTSGSSGSSGSSSGTSSGTSGTLPKFTFLGCCLPPLLLIIGGGLIAFFVARKRRASGTAGAPAPVGDDALSTKQLETKAGKLLVDVDDALKTSEQELGFAEAEFGSAAVEEYRTVLAEAKASVAEAFRIQQQVYDAEPEPEPTKREMLKRIIVLAGTADARLDEKAESFAKLRDLEGRAEEVLAAVTKRADALDAALPAASATLTQLKAAYLPAALGEVADDDEQATGLLTFTRTTIAQGMTAISEGTRGSAALSARAAEDAIAQAERLLAAVATAREQLSKARDAVGAEATALEQAAATAESQGSQELAPLAASARQTAANARAALAAPPFDPPAQLGAIRAVAAQLNTALGAARDAAARAQAARVAAKAAVTSARDRITSAEAYITTRRGAIGTEARSNLEEAKGRLASAETLVDSDPERALSEAQAAQQYAEAAARCAQSDVSGYDRGQYSGRPDSSGSGGSNMGEIIVGSILAGVLRDTLSGGSSSGGGGLGGGSSHSPFGGGGFSPGSFGGSGHRGGGGNFGGGGHRGGSGRF